MPTHDELAAIEEEGGMMATDRSKFAIDCPYLPGLHNQERKAWLRGFAKHRSSAEAIIDRDAKSIENTPHAG